MITTIRRSKLISLLRRLSPRLSRPGSKNSLQASPTICPWVQVEYSSESINDGLREDSQENDVSFQRELQLNELRKRMAGIPTASQVICYDTSYAVFRVIKNDRLWCGTKVKGEETWPLMNVLRVRKRRRKHPCLTIPYFYRVFNKMIFIERLFFISGHHKSR